MRCSEHYFTSLKHLIVTLQLLYLCMCVEELKQSHGQRFHSYVSLVVFLQVVGHGLPLWLCQQHVGLLLQRHLSTWRAHTSVYCWLDGQIGRCMRKNGGREKIQVTQIR